MKRQKTYMAKTGEVDAQWQLIDATGQTLGRLATRISRTLQGKEKPTYTPHILTGDYVVVINAARIHVTGQKLIQKNYYRHSGYTGNLKTFSLRDMLKDHPERVVQLAVKGMLPSTIRGREMLKRLKIYAAGDHPHQGQINSMTSGG